MNNEKETNILIENTVYSLFQYLLICKNTQNTIFVLGETVANKVNLKKIKKQDIYVYRNFELKRNSIKFFIEYIKLFKFLYRIKLLNRELFFYGNDNLNYFIFFKKKVFLLEDGMINYKLERLTLKKVIKNLFLLRPLFYKSYGYSKYVKKIYLTGLATIPKELEDKVEIINLKKLWKSKTKEEQKEILEVFNFNKEIIERLNERNIILYTQPLSEDGLIEEKEKINLYLKIISKYPKSEIVIKTHPREKTNYKNILKDILIIEENFPSEILELMEISFEKAVTIFSTAALNTKSKEIDFYGTRVHPKLLEKWGDSDLIMKANAFLEEE